MWMLSSAHKSMQRVLVAAADARASAKVPTAAPLPHSFGRPSPCSPLASTSDASPLLLRQAAREFYRRASHEEAPDVPLMPGGFVPPPLLPSLRSKSSSSKSRRSEPTSF